MRRELSVVIAFIMRWKVILTMRPGSTYQDNQDKRKTQLPSHSERVEPRVVCDPEHLLADIAGWWATPSPVAWMSMTLIDHPHVHLPLMAEAGIEFA